MPAVDLPFQFDLERLIVGVLNMSPGAAYRELFLMQAMAVPEGKDAGLVLLCSLAGSPQFEAVYPLGQNPNDWIDRFLGQLGLGGCARLRSELQSGSGSVSASLSLMVAMVRQLSTYRGNDPDLIRARQQLSNKVLVSLHFSLNIQARELDIETLRSVVRGIDSRSASLTGRIRELNQQFVVGNSFERYQLFEVVAGLAETALDAADRPSLDTAAAQPASCCRDLTLNSLESVSDQLSRTRLVQTMFKHAENSSLLFDRFLGSVGLSGHAASESYFKKQQMYGRSRVTSLVSAVRVLSRYSGRDPALVATRQLLHNRTVVAQFCLENLADDATIFQTFEKLLPSIDESAQSVTTCIEKLFFKSVGKQNSLDEASNLADGYGLGSSGCGAQQRAAHRDLEPAPLD